MQGVQPTALRELDDIMEKQLSGSETVKLQLLVELTQRQIF